jgi:hypothetical protein
MILDYLSNLSIMTQNQKMISSLKTNITDHLDALPQALQKLVLQWWIVETTISLIEKDVVR